MKIECNLWNIHQWLKDDDISHFYSIEENTGSFVGIRFSETSVDSVHYAIIRDEKNSRQYRSVLSYENSYIYFRTLNAHEAMNLLNQMMLRFTRWYQRMSRINLNHGTLEELMTVASSRLAFPLIILQNARTIAHTPGSEKENDRFQNLFMNPQSPNDYLECAKQNHHIDSEYPLVFSTPRIGRIVVDRIPFQHHFMWLIGLAGDRDITSGDLLLIHMICRIITKNLLLFTIRSIGSSNEQLDRYFLSCIRNLEHTEPEISFPLHRLFWKQDGLYTVYQMELTDHMDSFFLDMIYSGLKKNLPQAYPVLCDSSIYLFSYAEKPEQVLTEQDFTQMIPLDHLYIGQSNTQNSFSVIHSLIRQAQQSLTMARKLNRHFISTQSISTQYVYKQFYGDRQLQSYVHPTVRLLDKLDHDNPQTFGYLKTLEIYLITGANVSAAARRMHLHRNSFLNRIQRIRDLTDLNLTDSSELEALLLSLIIYKNYSTSSQL